MLAARAKPSVECLPLAPQRFTHTLAPTHTPTQSSYPNSLLHSSGVARWTTKPVLPPTNPEVGVTGQVVTAPTVGTLSCVLHLLQPSCAAAAACMSCTWSTTGWSHRSWTSHTQQHWRHCRWGYLGWGGGQEVGCGDVWKANRCRRQQRTQSRALPCIHRPWSICHSTQHAKSGGCTPASCAHCV